MLISTAQLHDSSRPIINCCNSVRWTVG